MGTWGAGPFENDAAADLLVEISDASFDFESQAWAFDDEYIEVDGGQIAIAMGALVTIGRGDGSGGPADVDAVAFAASLTDEQLTRLREWIGRVLADGDTSELYELWEESEDLDEWLAASRAGIALA
ncbi:DUF4259 domain-containing protein [Gordonia sp. PDNC005]|uniref:DUF4259 domain-containing protein n=1 Tax=unclassified Gordonia (in: high G+C Gram-positive bacteria) TaxID=2657482 RepID=UPI00196450C7|nr:DUF4259 domain-containing protein [Gordonia sp. PDNC005]QRY63976.1 DUF4259 domain-containing protein [Gordonia sp. PDNC005]